MESAFDPQFSLPPSLRALTPRSAEPYNFENAGDISSTRFTSEKNGGSLPPEMGSSSPNSPRKFGRYEVARELGKGAMGIVYLGRDPVIGRMVALKTIRVAAEDDVELREFNERFLREAQAAGILSHPNIVTVHDVGEETESKTSFIAMEYVEGKNIKQLLGEKTPFTFPRVAEMIGQVAEALDYAHRRGIVHRDVKPANIIITPEGAVKITDFGIAKIEKSNLTSTGQFLGTPNYMSPEQVTGEAVDGRSDLFSLGVVLYELLTRKKPFVGDNLTSISYKIVHESFTPPETYDASIPPEFGDILKRALAKDPASRFQRGNDFALALYEFKAREEEREMLRDLGKMVAEAENLGGPVSAVNAPAPIFPTTPSGVTPLPVPAAAPATPPPPMPAPPGPLRPPALDLSRPAPAPSAAQSIFPTLPGDTMSTVDASAPDWMLDEPSTGKPEVRPTPPPPAKTSVVDASAPGEELPPETPAPGPKKTEFAPTEIMMAPAFAPHAPSAPPPPKAPTPTPPPPIEPAEEERMTERIDVYKELASAPPPPPRPAAPPAPPAASTPPPGPVAEPTVRLENPIIAARPPAPPPPKPPSSPAQPLPKPPAPPASSLAAQAENRPTEVIVNAERLAYPPVSAAPKPTAPPPPRPTPAPAPPPKAAAPVTPPPTTTPAATPAAPGSGQAPAAKSEPAPVALKRAVNPKFVGMILGGVVLLAAIVVGILYFKKEDTKPVVPVDDAAARDTAERRKLQDDGNRAMQEGKYEEAKKHFQELLQRSPDSQFAKDGIAKAEQSLAEQKAKEAKAKEVESHLVLAREEAAKVAGIDDPKIVSECDLALAIDPENAEAKQLKADATDRISKKSAADQKKAAAELAKKKKSTPAPKAVVPVAVPTAKAAEPAAPTPTPATATLKISFNATVPSGRLMVGAGANMLFRKDFDFGKKSAGGLVEGSVSAPSGSFTLKVWVFFQDGTPVRYKEIQATLPGGDARTLTLSLDASKNLSYSLH